MWDTIIGLAGLALFVFVSLCIVGFFEWLATRQPKAKVKDAGREPPTGPG